MYNVLFRLQVDIPHLRINKIKQTIEDESWKASKLKISITGK